MSRVLKPSLMVIAATAMLLVSSPAKATMITATLPEFSGPINTLPTDPLLAGIFTYTIPTGEVIVAAKFTSTFGNFAFPNTALITVKLDDILSVGQCANEAALCFDSSNPTPFSYLFTPADFALLADGFAALTIEQATLETARLGAALLTIETAPSDLASTPEPASLALMAVGLTGAVSAAWRRRRARPDA